MSVVDDQHAAAEAEWLTAWLEGPKRTRWTALPPQVGDQAPNVTLPDTSGANRRLSDWWSHQFCEDYPPQGVLLGAIASATA